MVLTDLPMLNAFLNSVCTVLLVRGYMFVKKGDRIRHRKFMTAALGTSVVFLTSYLIYHYNVGSVAYPEHWTKTIYLAILTPHVILAGTVLPFIVAAVVHAVKGNFEKHKKLVKWVFPMWLFVAVTGVIIYLMNYQLVKFL